MVGDEKCKGELKSKLSIHSDAQLVVNLIYTVPLKEAKEKKMKYIL